MNERRDTEEAPVFVPPARMPVGGLRRLRVTTGAHVLFTVLLSVVVLVMVNVVSYRYAKQRWDISDARYFSLSEKTIQVLSLARGQVDVVTVFRPSDLMYPEVKRLLDAFAYEASRIRDMDLRVRHLDPARDLAGIRELVQQYGVTEEAVVVFSYKGRHKIVSAETLVDYDRRITPDPAAPGGLFVSKTRTAFRGEAVFASALHSLTQEVEPVVYVLTGHGEHDVADFGSTRGYGQIARLMRRDNMQIKSLMLAEQGGIPEDAAVLIIAGGRTACTQGERDVIADYLERSGRLFVLTDPKQVSGLEPILDTWGARLETDAVVGLTLTGRELFIRDYARHPVTQSLSGVLTVFFGTRSVERAWGEDQPLAADRPRVEVLAWTTEESWAERDLSADTVEFDAAEDRRGPISVAVAIERGPASVLPTELRRTRLVIVGDSDFVSNGALESGVGGNADLFLNAVNWLLERPSLLALSARPSHVIQPEMSEAEVRKAYLIITGLLPLVAVLFGLWVWVRRRR